jgi:hypothetical protein
MKVKNIKKHIPIFSIYEVLNTTGNVKDVNIFENMESIEMANIFKAFEAINSEGKVHISLKKQDRNPNITEK